MSRFTSLSRLFHAYEKDQSVDWAKTGVPRKLERLELLKFEPLHEKTNNLGLRPDLTQTGLYSQRRRIEA